MTQFSCFKSCCLKPRYHVSRVDFANKKKLLSRFFLLTNIKFWVLDISVLQWHKLHYNLKVSDIDFENNSLSTPHCIKKSLDLWTSVGDAPWWIQQRRDGHDETEEPSREDHQQHLPLRPGQYRVRRRHKHTQHYRILM